MAKASVQEIRLGALYRLGAKKRLDRAALECLLQTRCGHDAKVSRLLAGHWLTTIPYRLEA